MAATQLGSKAAGSTIKLKENGKLVEFYIPKHDYEKGLNGAGRTLLVRKDCYNKCKWNSTNVNPYADSAIDTLLNGTYKNLLDPSIRTAMGTTKIYYTPGNLNWSVTTLERSVFLLSATELGQTHANLKTEGAALSSTVLNLLKIAYLDGSVVGQWTRSPLTSYTSSAWYLNTVGGLNGQTCTVTLGCRPAFTLPSAFYINDDGSVSANTAPSTPGSISVPASINGGSTITVSWSAAKDTEGNLEGYKVERSTDGGSTWAQVYQGAGRSTTNTVQFGTESVMYRVRAYDSEGLASGWRTSGQVTVVNNTAPTVPDGITVPEQV